MPTTTSRLLLLLSLLQTPRDWPGQVLADRLEISPRTVRRDVDRLREMGYRISALKGPDGGYRLDAGAELPPLLFDDDQVLALAVALHSAPLTGAGIEEAAARALATVRQVMPSRLRHRLDGLQFTALPGRAAESVQPDVLLALSTAVGTRQVLRFDYAGAQSGDGDVGFSPPRRAEPHHLVASRGRWYLVAWDLDRNDWRIFRADRITPRLPAGPRFRERELPGGNVHDFLSARFRGTEPGKSPAEDWPCRGAVVLHLPAADVVPFAGDGTVEAVGSDRCRLEAGSWSWAALAAAFGRFDAELEVVGPPELASAFGTLAARFAAAAPR
ncbi:MULTISPECIES: YafY family protein [unclassified Arthrobacter]|uniref:helix-turn-helix transcriptional regulator n=1 Tax=unclassified Arthrobacter TaxID=235627 RepID=UPI001D13F5C4|nr:MULTISPECIES: WYL domain-containing protein [unclassified Arthrobacter]MCC3291404.1 WYL domain-containing protein [Arthrobacter sp. zg-Y1110]MCC3301222.1 WYL domain-containing protein [Arthrobacter sp. zg-Y895]MCC3302469.1 WYL domain-containing protein [Arthrobacter sp. zg-Y895]UWX83822.1 WYL domain-containing protein [Arthrobacter sp. zg-Y1110]